MEVKLSHDNTVKEVDSTQYWRIVGSLRYLIHTRPGLVFAIALRFMQRPRTEHLQAIKRILRYVEGTTDYSLHYPRCLDVEHFIGYSNSNLTGDIDTSKSTSRTLFFLCKCLISWQSVKQQVVALSSCEAEYIAATTALTQALWLARLLGDLLGKHVEAVELRVTASPPWHWRRTLSSMSTTSISASSTTSSEVAWMMRASRSATSTPRISSPTFSPSLLGRSSSRSFAPGLGWLKFPRRRHTRLRGRMKA